MVICQMCEQRPAVIQQSRIISGRLVYINLCEACYRRLQQSASQTSYLDKFGKDLTLLAREDKLDPVIGRKNEIERIIHILSRRTKNNPVLIGDPGVGKTAIVEGLAQKIVKNQVPETLQGKRLVTLDIAALLAGTSHRGQFEERLKRVIEEVVGARGQIILFVDEFHTVVGAGAATGAMDAANILKPALARGDLQMIGATTLDDYRKYVEKDAALERRFQPILVTEPTVKQTVEILEGLSKRYEKHHRVKILKEAMEVAAKLSDRYISDRFLPDKAIDLIDEACAEVRLAQVKEPENLKQVEEEIKGLKEKIYSVGSEREREKLVKKLSGLEKIQEELVELWKRTKLEEIPLVKAKDVVKIVAKMTGIPLEELSLEEKEKLLKLEERLHRRIVNQEEAVHLVSEAIRRARAGLIDPKRPIGSFIFLGPTGVGKTELTKALAEVLYGSEDLMVRLDMSEYMERHTVSKMVGAPPGYVGYDEGGQLTEIVRRKPFSVILLDEIEKAHPEVFNILLQILEDGRLTDAKGRTVNFKNTIIIMTSNVGSDLIFQTSIGFDSQKGEVKEERPEDYEELKAKLMEDLRKTFRPEFLNRVDEIVVFHALGKGEIRKIVDLQLEKTEGLLSSLGIELLVTEKARGYLAEKGYDPDFGARPLRRLIQREIENVISNRIIAGEYQKEDQIEISAGRRSLSFKVKKAAKVKVAV